VGDGEFWMALVRVCVLCSRRFRWVLLVSDGFCSFRCALVGSEFWWVLVSSGLFKCVLTGFVGFWCILVGSGVFW
jgi:hypothetical protein